MYSSTLYVSLADAFVFFLKSLNVFRNTLVNRSTSSRVVPIAAAAAKYVVGYAECDAPKPRNSIPPTVCVSPGAMTRVPETHRENNIDPNIVGDAPTLDAHVSVIAMEIGAWIKTFGAWIRKFQAWIKIFGTWIRIFGAWIRKFGAWRRGGGSDARPSSRAVL